MTATGRLRAPTAEDADALRELAEETFVASLALPDRADADRDHVREELRQVFSADAFADMDGRILHRDGQLAAAVVWTDGRHPLTGHQERVLDHVLARPSALAELRRVLVAVVADASIDGLDAVRAEVDAAGDTGRADVLAALGFVDHYFITRRAIRATAPDPACRASDNSHRSFAVRCLTDAVVAGLATGPFVPQNVDRRAVEDFVSTRLVLGDGGTALSYVATADEGDPAAHADVRLQPARHGGGTEALLNDVYVLPEARGRGWAQRLTGHVESELHARGVCRMEGTVVLQHGVTPSGLVERLSAAGWWIDRRSMVLPVTPPASVGGSGL